MSIQEYNLTSKTLPQAIWNAQMLLEDKMV